MKRFPLALIAAAVALVVIAVLAGVGRPEAARGDTGAVADSVTTTGHGVVTVAPDEATVTAGVHTQAATAADALSQNAARMNDVIAALKTHGGKDLQTQQVSLYPQSKEEGTSTGNPADNSVSGPCSITARTTPAVPSGRSVTDRSPRSANEYISLLTTSVDSPTPRA